MKMMVKYHGKLIGFGKTRYHFLYGNVPSKLNLIYSMAKKRNFIINFKIEMFENGNSADCKIYRVKRDLV